MKYNFLPLFIFAVLAGPLFAQSDKDTLSARQLREVTINSQRFNMGTLPAIQGTYLFGGNKSEVISMQNVDANITERTARQIFAKVPGLFVYDMDGSGNQMNFSTRGLDPHRGWEFNIRANGIMTNSDIYGYPASHFSVPMEALEKIELVRGTGALQYGAQFGGMLNYVFHKPDTTRALGYETINAVGSFGSVSTFHSIGGKVGKLKYYAYYNRRTSRGYRDNSHSDFDAQGAVLTYAVSSKFQLGATVARSNYLYKIPGPINDEIFNADPKTSTRSRNYFSPEIYVPSLSADWQIGRNTHLSWTAAAVLGVRNSVQFDKPATTVDAINATTLQYAARQVDVDHFNSYNSELRLLQNYRFLGEQSSLVAGVQYINNDLHRTQLGVGTTGSDYDLTLTKEGWGRDLHFKTQNVAFFVENKFQLTSRFSVTPGARVENGVTHISGTLTYKDPTSLPETIDHQFPVFGVNANFKTGENHNLYAGWSQAYRPVVFKDIIPNNAYEVTSQDLKDAYGYNMELGYRGTTEHFRWDVSGFLLQYNNRLGTQAIEGTVAGKDTFLVYKTNVGSSLTKGVEFFAEYAFVINSSLKISIFSSTSYMDARYQDNAAVKFGNETKSITNNKVESVPEWISRNGLNVKYKKLSASVLYSYTASSFADPLNTVKPSATGSVGLVPSYGITDLNFSMPLSRRIFLRFNCNNLLDVQYFTKRPVFYPGPGVWPSDGRSVNASVAIRL